MPDADGKIRGIALGGKAADAWLRIFGTQEELFERQPPTFDEMIPPLEEEPIRPPEAIAWFKENWDNPALTSQFYEDTDEAR